MDSLEKQVFRSGSKITIKIEIFILKLQLNFFWYG